MQQLSEPSSWNDRLPFPYGKMPMNNDSHRLNPWHGVLFGMALLLWTACFESLTPHPVPIENATKNQNRPARIAWPEAQISEHHLVFPKEQVSLLAKWYAQVNGVQPGETFGSLVIRTAKSQLGKPYALPPFSVGLEKMVVRLDTFECVSFVETSLAVARCVWLGTEDPSCFIRQMETIRYQGGILDDFASRLHYFSHWLLNHNQRENVWLKTQYLGGDMQTQRFFFMSTHPWLYPPLSSKHVLDTILQQEQWLSKQPLGLLEKNQVPRAQQELAHGDILGIASSKYPGLLIGHVGFVDRTCPFKKPRLLHASSYHGRVLVIASDIADYVQRRPDRLGLLIAEPVEPRLQ